MSDTERATAEPAVRVSTLELFFDLVFVFTITQLTGVLANDTTLRGIAGVTLMLWIILWMYGGYAWLTNAVAPNNRFRRSLMLVGMGGFLAIALAIPDSFGAAGWVFGAGYFVVNAVHSGLFLIAGGPGAVRAMSRLAPLNLTSAGLVLAGGILPGGWRYGLWVAALVIQVVAPLLHSIGGFNLSPAHFVERHGLLVIIVLGESIVAIGVGAAGLAVDLRLIFVAVLGLTLTYLIWWVYFEGGDDRAEHALAALDPARRAMAGLLAYGYAHFVLLLGIVAVAAGIKKAVGHATGHLTAGQAVALAGGLAVFLVGDVAFRRVLRIGTMRYRVAGAVLALATVPLGLVLAIAQLAALIVLLMAMLFIEYVGTGRPAAGFFVAVNR